MKTYEIRYHDNRGTETIENVDRFVDSDNNTIFYRGDTVVFRVAKYSYKSMKLVSDEEHDSAEFLRGYQACLDKVVNAITLTEGT